MKSALWTSNALVYMQYDLPKLMEQKCLVVHDESSDDYYAQFFGSDLKKFESRLKYLGYEYQYTYIMMQGDALEVKLIEKKKIA